MLDNGQQTPFKFYFGAPSCVPATAFETAGAEIDLNDIEEILGWQNVTYLAEMMNYPGVLYRDQMVMDKIKLALKMGKKVDGHAPGLRGQDAINYIKAGISTDHECFTKEEALDKLAGGMKILIREGSAAKNFEALYSLIDEYPDQIMFCSDDKHPNELAEGHINQLARRAIAKGCNLFNVLRACSLTPIQHYNMDVGLLQKGDQADFCIVEDLLDFRVSRTYIDGLLVSEEGRSKIKSVAVNPVNSFDCQSIKPTDLRVEDRSKKVRVIQVEDGQLITKEISARLNEQDGYLKADLENDILKIVVVNRYFDAPPAIGFVQNFGLKSGAIASCVAHDSHNIIAVGTCDEDTTQAINLIIQSKGGISLTDKDYYQVLPLPIAGIMSAEDGYKVANSYANIDKKAKELGSQLEAPFMTLSFCALLVIPELKLSDKGLFDGKAFSLTSIYVD
jgi:adenine deaminase